VRHCPVLLALPTECTLTLGLTHGMDKMTRRDTQPGCSSRTLTFLAPSGCILQATRGRDWPAPYHQTISPDHLLLAKSVPSQACEDRNDESWKGNEGHRGSVAKLAIHSSHDGVVGP
jgi:hypothetical protein